MKTQISNSGKLWINSLSGVIKFGDERLGKVAVSDIEAAVIELRGVVLVRGDYNAKQARRDQISQRLALSGIVTI